MTSAGSAKALARSSPANGPLAICYGTRPQVIKASVLIDVLSQRWDLLTVDTGQHYDYELNALLYEQLGVPRPHRFLGVASGGHAQQTSSVLTGAAEVIASARPWGVLVIGDTNSTLGCALAAAKLRVPVIHVEAGLRATDAMMAEEINRRVVDAISTVLCAPSAPAAARLQLEHVAGSVSLTGDVARDVLLRHVNRVPDVGDAPWWPCAPHAPFILATLHRAELTDDGASMRGVLRALGELGLPVLLPAHPRLREALRRRELIEALPNTLHLLPPLGYLETLACIRHARAVVTDSGGVQREAYWLGTPCITLRRETEWTETVQLGANVLVSPQNAATELPATVQTRMRLGEAPSTWDADAYGDGYAAIKIRSAINQMCVE